MLSVAVSPTKTSTASVTALKDIYTEMNSLNTRITSDTVLGLIFQSRIENFIQNNPARATPRFETIVNNFDICLKQWEDYSQSSTNIQSQATSSMLLTLTEVDESNFDAFLAEIPEENWPEALDFYAATEHWCWNCRAPDHYLRQHQKATYVGSLYTQPLGQAGINLTSSTNPPSKTQNYARRLADLYRPQYQSTKSRYGLDNGLTPLAAKGGVLAQLMEIGSVLDDLDELDFRTMSLEEDILPTPTSTLLLGSET
ncbi:uncharacterized protein PGTG_04205 [Puccinia graminis f. sp. tritici CRL 75-36-700-3]|uniref:Uncharacterized protein n=1 Tax=Puccinia graminis f. sp. tritici (strain CRL 75-36-700-3 / race SCCL) TaxID=418459 RepID=E3K1S4_PUCGT|nr:uncharacterized protein PGTG_04205 [Puccinia graminis f. sp. tritici CRL 75-36-700-3]EFP78249.1 hypothetical protein PGTG_04205 [Puccinia graminis f. sp. tritici CRL 75-36-700-3]